MPTWDTAKDDTCIARGVFSQALDAKANRTWQIAVRLAWVKDNFISGAGHFFQKVDKLGAFFVLTCPQYKGNRVLHIGAIAGDGVD